MSKPMRTYEPFSTVVALFPFTDRSAHKKRSAVVLSSRTFQQETNSCTCAMITSVPYDWPGDIQLSDPACAGLSIQSKVRLKFFTLDLNLTLRPLGHLCEADRNNLIANLATYCSLEPAS
ncbi:type II toxin-antitoxin system PemK/MazF family toxin [Sulfurivirga caldicuralii]|uniref:type II toxin-antitoxin system PemK/MazF family toxin n=1 Tax=Sulfurivirga caldicuralii TaxID=364032 RepID=UPI00389A54B4